jgi:hypothetical protein
MDELVDLIKETNKLLDEIKRQNETMPEVIAAAVAQAIVEAASG